MAKITTTTEDKEEFIKGTGSTLTSDIVDLANHGSENYNYITHFPKTGGVAIFEKFPNNATKGKY